MLRNKNAHKQTGLSLMEVMITVGIIGLLAAVAIPLYQDQARTNKRTDGIIAITKLAYALETFRSDTGDYTQADLTNYITTFDTAAEAQADPVGCTSRGFTGTGGPPLGAGAVFTSCKGFYNVAVTAIAAPTAAGVASTFTLTATPIPGRDQANDECTSFTLNQLGVKGATRSGTAAALPAGVTAVQRCWGSN